jgi:hypothetical protein
MCNEATLLLKMHTCSCLASNCQLVLTFVSVAKFHAYITPHSNGFISKSNDDARTEGP